MSGMPPSISYLRINRIRFSDPNICNGVEWYTDPTLDFCGLLVFGGYTCEFSRYWHLPIPTTHICRGLPMCQGAT